MAVPRLFVPGALAGGLALEAAPAQAHYLGTVLRLDRGAAVALFNGHDGEWLARIDALGRRGCVLRVERQTRPQRAESDLWLVFAPIKRARIDYLVEKATELGAAALLPVRTGRTVVERLNRERLAAHAVEAAEQSGRLTVPEIREMVRLDALLAGWPSGRTLVLAAERGGPPAIAESLLGLAGPERGGLAVLVGPEGGFAETELDALGKLPFVKPVGLGPRVLRADTAALAALAVLQALIGDWRGPTEAAGRSPGSPDSDHPT